MKTWGDVYRGIDGANLLGTLGKGSCENKNPHHHHDVAVRGSAGESLDTLTEAAWAAYDEGPGAGGHKGHGDGHLVEVAYHNGGGDIEQEEHQQWAENP